MKPCESRRPIGRRIDPLNIQSLRRQAAARHHRLDVTDPSSWGPHRPDSSRSPRP